MIVQFIYALAVSQYSDPGSLNFNSVDWYLPNGSFYTTINAWLKESDGFDIDNQGNIKRGALTGDCTASAGSGVLTCAGIGSMPTGKTDGSVASAGQVGQFVESCISQASATTLTAGAAKTVTSITLGAGDWIVGATPSLSGALTIGLAFTGAVSTTTNTLPSQASQGGADRVEQPLVSTGNADLTLNINNRHKTVTSSTTYFLVESVAFSLGTALGFGCINALRIH